MTYFPMDKMLQSKSGYWRGAGLRCAVLLIALALNCFAGRAEAQNAQAKQAAPKTIPAKELVVAVMPAPPFVIKRDDGSWGGISIELWRRIADNSEWKYRFAEQQSVPDLLAGLADGKFDVVVAPLTVTAERERMFDFTAPFYATGLGIAVTSGGALSWRPVISALTSFGFLQAVLALVGLALVFGLIVWLFERRHNEQFGGTVARGLSSSVWWTTVAMTQRGAGMSGPRTMPGRAVAMIWMVGSIIAIAIFTASITSALTVRHLEGSVHGVADLTDVRVGTVAGTSGEETLNKRHIKTVAFANIPDGLMALRTGKIDAFVYDKPLLAWMIGEDFSGSIQLLDTTFDPQNYALALPVGSPLRKHVNIALLEALRSRWWEDLQVRYLGYR